MKFFIDTADINEIREANARGWVDGVTTNPTLVAKVGKKMNDVIKEICREVKGPVSAEVISLQADKIFQEGLELAKLADNVVVKIPMCEEGLVAVRRFAAEGKNDGNHRVGKTLLTSMIFRTSVMPSPTPWKGWTSKGRSMSSVASVPSPRLPSIHDF